MSQAEWQELVPLLDLKDLVLVIPSSLHLIHKPGLYNEADGS